MRKPSEIKADFDAAQALIDEAAAPHRAKQEELRREKSALVNHYGQQLAKIRADAIKKGPAAVEQFRQWRETVRELDEDDRGAVIDARVKELGLDE